MAEVTNEDYTPKFPKTVYVERDLEQYFDGNEFTFFTDLDASERGEFVAVYELKSVGVTGTRIRAVKAVK